MESSVDSTNGTPAPTPAPMPAPAPSHGEVFAPGDPSFMPSEVSISATQSDLNRMCAQAQIERTVAQLTQQDADREHALLQPAQILQAEHQSLQDQYGADQAAISESMAFLNFESSGYALEDKCGLKTGGSDDASTSGISAPTPAPTRAPTATPAPISALFAAPHTTAKPPQPRPLTEDELGTSKAHSSTVKGDGAMESSVASERADQMTDASSKAPLHLAGLLGGDQSESSEYAPISLSEAPSSGND